MSILRSEAIKAFLIDYSKHPFAHHYDKGMEVQVNVDPGTGTKQGNRSWTDGTNTWYDFRMPKKDLTHNDKPQRYSLIKHTLALGCTGWDYTNSKSRWVGFDVDAIAAHKGVGLDETDISKLIEAVSTVDFVHIIRSTGGNGYHLYVFLDPYHCPNTANHTEHSWLAKAILNKISGLCGLDLTPKIDACGTILWIYHKHQAENAYELIKEGVDLVNVPSFNCPTPRVNGIHRSNSVDFSVDSCGLDQEHLRLTNWLDKNKCSHWWDADKRLLVCHTFDLGRAHRDLKLIGYYSTISDGKSGANTGSDHNCFAVPIEDGAWILRRFTLSCKESVGGVWFTDGKGFTTCYYNTFATLDESRRSCGAVKNDDGSVEVIGSASHDLLQRMGVAFDTPTIAINRVIKIKKMKGGTDVSITFPREDNDERPDNFIAKKGQWVGSLPLPQVGAIRVRVPHEKIRHVVCNSSDAGWYCSSNYGWVAENKSNVSSVLRSLGYQHGTIDLVLGKAITQHWILTTQPFTEEYPGKRQWNKGAAQLAYEPLKGNYDVWKKVLYHCGKSLTLTIRENAWCKTVGIDTGYDYLLLWCAWLFQHPTEQLPFLFFYSEEQNTGKSTFHESLGILFRNAVGYSRADVALVNSSRFNSELEGAVLCAVEEVDLSNQQGQAYNRIKDWVTSLRLPIHKKGLPVYDVPNTTHWVQCANNIAACPILPGDTRITAVYVDKPLKPISKSTLRTELKKQAAAFTYAILTTELPSSIGRLNIPTIETGEKQDEQKRHSDPVCIFIDTNCDFNPGCVIKFSDFYDAIRNTVDLSSIAVSRLIPSRFPRGKIDGSGYLYIGNMVWSGQNENRVAERRLERVGERLKATLDQG